MLEHDVAAVCLCLRTAVEKFLVWRFESWVSPVQLLLVVLEVGHEGSGLVLDVDSQLGVGHREFLRLASS